MEERYFLKKPGTNKNSKRLGRGPGSGHGKTSCRGQKGQLCRSGSKKRVWFEGGQMPLQRRVPKRGFNNIFKKYYQIVNLSQLSKINVDEINPDVLVQNRIIKKPNKLIKILGTGELKRSIKVMADAFSASAKLGIEKAGGEVLFRQLYKKKDEI